MLTYVAKKLQHHYNSDHGEFAKWSTNYVFFFCLNYANSKFTKCVYAQERKMVRFTSKLADINVPTLCQQQKQISRVDKRIPLTEFNKQTLQKMNTNSRRISHINCNLFLSKIKLRACCVKKLEIACQSPLNNSYLLLEP